MHRERMKLEVSLSGMGFSWGHITHDTAWMGMSARAIVKYLDVDEDYQRRAVWANTHIAGGLNKGFRMARRCSRKFCN
jgi:hypothetical protein